MSPVVAVVGASGFVGSACASALEQAGCTVIRLHAPRLAAVDLGSPEVALAAAELATRFRGANVVVNCAGNPDASAADYDALRRANAVLPGVIGKAALQADVGRFIHVSSAVVQGRLPVLDSSDTVDVFSPYARSKAKGERAARALGPTATTIYRPPSVHGPSRRVTRQLARIASSPAATVARPGTSPTPQTHIDNVADALVLLATSAASPPPVVHHPWEGHTTAGLLELLGNGRTPRILPVVVARTILGAIGAVGRIIPRLRPSSRRIEMIWFGQHQAPSWLTEQGWRPLTTEADWLALGRAAHSQHDVHPGKTNHD